MIQETLLQCEQKFQNIVNACPMGIYLYELQEKDRLVFAGYNPIADTILGIKHSTFVGKSIEEIFPALRWTDIPFRYREVATKGVIYKNDHFFYTDGSERIFDILAFQTKSKEMAVFFQDITERNRIEEALRQSEEKLRFLSENLAQGMVYQINSGKDGKSRKFTYLSHAIERLHGITVEEAYENSALVYQQLIEKDKQMVQEKEDYATKTMTTFFADVMVKLPSGEHRWRRFISTPRFSSEGDIIWDGIELDITQQKESEMMLANEKERLAVTLKSIGDGVIATDISGNVTMMNPVAEKITGYTLKEAQGKPLSSIFFIISESTGEPLENPVLKVLATKKTIELANNTILLSKNGVSHIISDSASPIFDTERNMLGVVLVFRDITEKQKFIEETKKIQKLETLGIIAGGIAHDFNNLLGGIFGCIDLAYDIAQDDKVCEYLQSALQTLQRARSLTHHLLTFAKGGNPVCTISPVFPFVKETVKFVLSGSSVLCNFEESLNLWPCNFDKSQIGQVIENLVLNARQARETGCILTISASNHVIQEHKSLAAGKYVCISFADNGPGIPAPILPRIFDPFFTTKPRGNGLGLCICYSIINRHGGTIQVESTEGKGTVFHVFLPAYDRILFDTPRKFKFSQKHKGSGKILLMDDEKMLRKALGGMLSRMGYEVTCLENGQEAIDAFLHAQKEGHSFKAVILDLTVPGGMGGKETALEIRKMDKDVAIFASSGYSQDPVMSKPKEYGFTDSICKPFKTLELGELLEKNLTLKI